MLRLHSIEGVRKVGSHARPTTAAGSDHGRETYEFSGDDQFVETFELAPPGKPFHVYSRTQLKRVR